MNTRLTFIDTYSVTLYVDATSTSHYDDASHLLRECHISLVTARRRVGDAICTNSHQALVQRPPPLFAEMRQVNRNLVAKLGCDLLQRQACKWEGAVSDKREPD